MKHLTCLPPSHPRFLTHPIPNGNEWRLLHKGFLKPLYRPVLKQDDCPPIDIGRPSGHDGARPSMKNRTLKVWRGTAFRASFHPARRWILDVQAVTTERDPPKKLLRDTVRSPLKWEGKNRRRNKNRPITAELLPLNARTEAVEIQAFSRHRRLPMREWSLTLPDSRCRRV